MEELFSGAQDKAARDERIYQAVRVHGYILPPVAEFLGLYNSTIGVVAKRVAQTRERQKMKT